MPDVLSGIEGAQRLGTGMGGGGLDYYFILHISTPNKSASGTFVQSSVRYVITGGYLENPKDTTSTDKINPGNTLCVDFGIKRKVSDSFSAGIRTMGLVAESGRRAIELYNGSERSEWFGDEGYKFSGGVYGIYKPAFAPVLIEAGFDSDFMRDEAVGGTSFYLTMCWDKLLN